MAATTRRSRIIKRKGSGITFGHFALPVAAVVALGLLFVGIKLFFLTPDNHGAAEITRIETPVFSEQPAALADEPDFMLAESDPEIIVPEKLETTDVSLVLASPLTQSGNPARASSGTAEQTAGTKNTQKRASAASAAKTSRPASTAAAKPSTNAKWGVQVGSFVNEGSASTLVSEIKKQGYSASVSKADLSGKTFHRVRVEAGNSREDADSLAVKLRDKGYPVSVVPML
ncbi:MAG: SPOR domain-containing protein [Synergistaceae bacterium]|jgi:cell division septation protein DedD|nr:SPOR domain-containing protein [Synergistaceae bacterium]